MNNSILGITHPPSEEAGEYYDPMLAPIRSHLNPLRSLTMARPIALLEMSMRGYYADLTWLYAHLEKREHIMASLVERRQSTLGQCIWSVDLTEKAAKDDSLQAIAHKQQEFVQELFANIDNLKEAWKWLGMARFRGYAHLEKHYSKSTGETKHLEPVPQWFWCRNWPSLKWQFNPSALNTNRGEPIDSDDFVVREVPASLGELAVFDYIRKALCIKDWGTFASTFGIPNIFLECLDKERYPTEQEMASWQTRLKNYVSNGRGVLPPGVKANMFGGGSSENTPFPGLVDYLDKMLVLAGTGGKLTMLSDATGIGQGATPAHEKVWEEIAAEEGNEIAEILHRSIAEVRLKEEFPDEDIHVRFTIKRRGQVDQAAGADLLGKLKTAGWDVNEEEAEKLTGLDLTKSEPVEQSDPLESGATTNRTTPTEHEDSIQKAEEAIVASLGSVINRLNRILEIEDDDMRTRSLTDFVKDLPEELRKANVTGDADRMVEKLLVESLTSGLSVEKGT